MSSTTTAISWTDRTWSPVVGCTKVSQGCKFCYAKTLHDKRHQAFQEGKLQNIPQYAKPFETVQLIPSRLDDPRSWRKPARVFVNPMGDLFHEDVPDAFIADVFVVMAECERHSFQVLTKCPERMLRWFTDYLPEACSGEQPAPIWPLPNVWLGVSVENQAAADERIPLLLRTPAAVRFLSCEPLLGPVDLTNITERIAEHSTIRYSALDVGGRAQWAGPRIDWVIGGGESGTRKQNVRPVHPAWARSLRDQCIAAGVPFHFKQWGRFVTEAQSPADIVLPGEYTDASYFGLSGDGYYDLGAKRAGRELDGRIWDEFPAVRS